MKRDPDACRRCLRDAKTIHEEVISYGELVATGDLTWEDLLAALPRTPLNAEDAAMRLHVHLGISKSNDRVILDQQFWRRELSARHIAPIQRIAELKPSNIVP